MVTGKSASTVAKAPQQPPQPGADKKLGPGPGQMNGAPAPADPQDRPEKPAPQDPPTPPQPPEKPDEPVHAAAPELEDEADFVESPETIIQMRTMRGDLAQAIVDLVKNQFIAAWEKASEHTQKVVIQRANDLAKKLVNEAVRLSILDGAEQFEMTINNFTVDPEKGLVAKIVMPRDNTTLAAVNSALGKAGYFIPLNTKDYMGQRPKTLEPDNIGSLGIPKEKINEPVPGHAIKLEEAGEGENMMKVATCECGTWKSSIGIADADKLAPVIAAHLEQARAQAKVGRGPVDAQGQPVTADAKTGEVVEREIDKTATQRTAGDIGPATPAAKPTEPASA